MVDIEAAPDKLRLLGCEGGCLVHTNNFTDPAGIGVAEPPNPKRHFSMGRRSRLGELLGAREKIAVEDIEADLRDHLRYPYGICRHARRGPGATGAPLHHRHLRHHGPGRQDPAPDGRRPLRERVPGGDALE